MTQSLLKDLMEIFYQFYSIIGTLKISSCLKYFKDVIVFWGCRKRGRLLLVLQAKMVAI
jgi:hypothetical protein